MAFAPYYDITGSWNHPIDNTVIYKDIYKAFEILNTPPVATPVATRDDVSTRGNLLIHRWRQEFEYVHRLRDLIVANETVFARNSYRPRYERQLGRINIEEVRIRSAVSQVLADSLCLWEEFRQVAVINELMYLESEDDQVQFESMSQYQWVFMKTLDRITDILDGSIYYLVAGAGGVEAITPGFTGGWDT